MPPKRFSPRQPPYIVPRLHPLRTVEKGPTRASWGQRWRDAAVFAIIVILGVIFVFGAMLAIGRFE